MTTTTASKVLQSAWEERRKIMAKSAKLWAKGYEYHHLGLHDEAEKLWAKANKLHAKGDQAFKDVVTAEYGSEVTFTWGYASYTLHLSNGLTLIFV